MSDAQILGMMNDRLTDLDSKVDQALIEIATLRTEFRLSVRIAMAVVGFCSGIAGATIISVLT